MTAIIEWGRCECVCIVNHPDEPFPCEGNAEADGLCWACEEWWKRDGNGSEASG